MGSINRNDIEESVQRLVGQAASPSRASICIDRDDTFSCPFEKSLEALVLAAGGSPPPSVHALARRLGYVAATTLQRRHPKECHDLRKARAAWRDEKFSRLRVSLEAALNADVPRSVKQICRDCCVREETVAIRFPDIKQKLRARYLDWLMIERKRKEIEFESSVRAAVNVLHRQRQYPSVGAVISVDPSLKSGGWEKLTRAIGKTIDLGAS